MQEIIKQPIQTAAYWLVSLVLGIYLLEKLSFILIPVTWSVFMSFAILPLCNWLEERRIPRIMAIVISILSLTVVAGIVIYAMLHQMMGLLEEAPEMGRKLEQYLLQIQSSITRQLGFSFEGDVWNPLSVLNTQQLNIMVRTTAQTLANLAIIPILSFFFIYYKDFFNEFVTRLKLKTNSKFPAWAGEISKVIQGYLTGILIVTAIVSVLAGIVFYALGVKYFILFALFVAVFNLIPYVGVVLSSLVTIFYVFLTTESLLFPVLTLALLWFIQIVENNLITPVLVGGRIRLNALSVIIAILIGGSLWGISGMVLFIPILGVVKIMFDQSDSLNHYGYLLGVDVPVTERNENFLKLLKRKWRKSPGSGSL